MSIILQRPVTTVVSWPVNEQIETAAAEFHLLRATSAAPGTSALPGVALFDADLAEAESAGLAERTQACVEDEDK
jgi:hypothetical protein